MKRMQFYHHKFALTLTVVLVAMLGVVLGVQIDRAANELNALIIMEFGFILVVLVLLFILVSVVLRSREELYMVHEDLRACIESHAVKSGRTTSARKRK